MKFKSKIDWWMHATFVSMPLVTVWIAILFALNPDPVTGVAVGILVLCNIFILPWWFSTYYVLGGHGLLIKFGLGKGKHIPYPNILSVKETRSMLASMALSLDRIEIKFRDGKTGSFTNVILISPVNKQEFMRLLKEKRTAV